MRFPEIRGPPVHDLTIRILPSEGNSQNSSQYPTRRQLNTCCRARGDDATKPESILAQKDYEYQRRASFSVVLESRILLVPFTLIGGFLFNRRSYNSRLSWLAAQSPTDPPAGGGRSGRRSRSAKRVLNPQGKKAGR